jgi:hypothetical protein
MKAGSAAKLRGPNVAIQSDPSGHVMDLYGRKPVSVEGGAPGSVRAPQVKDFADHLFNRSTDVAYRHYE